MLFQLFFVWMVDHRMGIYGYPIEIQAFFFMALRCARRLLRAEGGEEGFIAVIDKRLRALRYHLCIYFWLDFQQLNNIFTRLKNTLILLFDVNP